jgi:nitroreductase
MSHHRLNIEAEIDEFIANRWSPRSFSKKPISENDLKKLFEAARWAPSSSNDQPWAFIVARQGDGHYDRLFEALVSGNQKWAYTAPVLVATLARKNLTKGEGKNTHAWHDLGLAMGNLSLQATTMGIQVHQMGGIIPAKLIENFEVDEDTWDVVTMFVLGY